MISDDKSLSEGNTNRRLKIRSINANNMTIIPTQYNSLMYNRNLLLVDEEPQLKRQKLDDQTDCIQNSRLEEIEEQVQ